MRTTKKTITASTNLDILAGGTQETSPHSKLAYIISNNEQDITWFAKVICDLGLNIASSASFEEIKQNKPIFQKPDLILISDEAFTKTEYIDYPDSEIILILNSNNSNLKNHAGRHNIKHFLTKPLDKDFCILVLSSIINEKSKKTDLINTLETKYPCQNHVTAAEVSLEKPNDITKVSATLASFFTAPERIVFPIYKIITQNYIQSNLDFNLKNYDYFAMQGIYEEDLLHIGSLRQNKNIKMNINYMQSENTEELYLSTHMKDIDWLIELQKKLLFDDLKWTDNTITAVTFLPQSKTNN